MSELYREQFPLLCDDLSDEEHYNPQYQRQYRHMTYRNRARTNAKGALTILKRWPEHWSSFLTYWWIGVAMICLMTLILYNSLFALSIIPTAHFKPIKSQLNSLNTIHFTFQEVSQFPNVYTHIFTSDKQEIEINNYLPHIKAIANKYSSFNYHLVVVFNDTSIDSPELNPEENNINALNSLWTKDFITKKDKAIASNIIIEYISLTKYMNNSPFSKYWRTLSNELIEFLIRAVSIWDKGGVTFNPIILTQQTPNCAYLKKIEDILRAFGHREKTEKSSNENHYKFKQTVNNIRDIINVMEHENNLDSSHDELLAEAESKNAGLMASSVYRRSISKNNVIYINKPVSKVDSNTKSLVNNEHDLNKTETILEIPSTNGTTTLPILPSFLDYLFNHNTINNQDDENSKEKYTKDIVSYISNEKNLRTDTVKENKYNTNPITEKSTKIDETWMSPMIIPADEVAVEIKEIKNNNSYPRHLPNINNLDHRLTIDIKGNLIATKTACHAFLGSIFTDAIHCGYKEKLSDFIIKELSIFCNGVISSCNGIDIIIL